jgi:hypothetical protein
MPEQVARFAPGLAIQPPGCPESAPAATYPKTSEKPFPVIGFRFLVIRFPVWSTYFIDFTVSGYLESGFRLF